MLKTYKKQLIAASLLTLLPIVVGLLLMDRLPLAFATHWGIDGQPDGWSSRSFAIFVPPLIMLALFWLCVYFTCKDPGNQGRNKKPLGMVFWIVPFLSNLVSGMMYALALGVELSIHSLILCAMGLMFVVIGNYMPKCQMNSTVGIRISWTYSSEENWNATHRFAGRIWVIAGALMMFSALLPAKLGIAVMLFGFIPMVTAPMLYSYRYYKMQLARGDELRSMPARLKKTSRIGRVMGITALLLCAVLLFTGNVEVVFEDTAFTVDSVYHEALTVEYAAIDALEYRSDDVPGLRVGGFGSPRLLLGFFENDEFGTYTRYTYTNADSGIVITVGEKILVISGKDPAETQAIYQTLLERTGK